LPLDRSVAPARRPRGLRVASGRRGGDSRATLAWRSRPRGHLLSAGRASDQRTV